jgi:hypothetical protein
VTLDARPTAGGLTVPFMVDEKLRPVDFRIVDKERVDLCARQGRCGVCGGKIRRGPVAFIGPDDGRTCFADPWMHPECAALATRQCPFIGGRRDWREEGAREAPLLTTYSQGMATVLAHNWRAHRENGAWHFEAVGPVTRGSDGGER